MSPTSKYNPNALYFTEKLKTKLRAISNFPLTVIEAPMGYGKTTAVRSALRQTDFIVLWQTIYGDGVSYFWTCLCDSISRFNPDLSDNLRQLVLPGDVVQIRKAVELINTIRLEMDTVIVLDDYHFVNSHDVDNFFSFLLMNIPEKIHMVIISRTAFLYDDIAELRLKGFVNYIGTDSFTFDLDDISGYYALCGITITKKEQRKLFEYSEGWITPLYLSMLEYNARGSFTASGDVDLLLRNTIYKPLREELKDFLNCICMFDSFSVKQMQYMWQKENADKLLYELLLGNAFISQDTTTGRYSFHNLFITHVREVFDLHPIAVKKKLWERAGHWHLDNREFLQTIDCFEKADNFSLLLVAIAREYDANIKREHKEKIIECFDRCPEEIKAQNLAAILVFIRFMISYNEVDRLKECCTVFERNIAFFDGSEEEKTELKVKYEYLFGITKYNNIKASEQHYKKALSYKNKSPLGEEKKWHWTMGSPSVLLNFYRESGKLSEHVQDMKECMTVYYQLTDGHGYGAEYVMEAEAAFYTGEFEKAESIIHKGLYYAREKKQWSILLAASFLQARLAFMRCNYFEVTNIMSQMLDLLESKKQYLLLHTLDMSKFHFDLLMGMPERVPEWISNGDFTKTRVMFPAMPALHIVYGRYLLLKGDFTKLIGMADVFIQVASVYPNLFGHIYTYIYLAAVYNKLSRKDEAALNLKKALDIALPDRVYMPFVENGGYIADLLKALMDTEQYDDHIAQILAIYKNHAEAVKKMMRTQFSEKKTGLTSRENEIAVLAAGGLSNKDIAGKLFITENTVKTRLKSVFDKLSINSRRQLQGWLEKEKE